MYKKIASVAVMVIATCGLARAQSVAPATLNAAGGSTMISGNTYEWSVGEMCMVSTFSLPAMVLTQGVLQPLVVNTGAGVQQPMVAATVHVFPNPASSMVVITYDAAASGNMDYSFSDIAGKVLLHSRASIVLGSNRVAVDIASFPAATYLLEVSTGENPLSTASFKIEKVN